MTLLAVTPAGSEEVKLNPGLEHIMHKDDICYFIGFSSEEYSRVGGATSIHHTLKDVCASIAVVSMITSGIDPSKFDERKVTVGGAGEGTHKDQVDFHPSNDETVNFFIPQNSSEESLHMVSPVGPPSETVGEAVHEARRGLQLLRYHSRMDMHANPVVKYKLTSSHQDLHNSSPNFTPKQSVASMMCNLHPPSYGIDVAEHIKSDHQLHHMLDHHTHPVQPEHVVVAFDTPDTGLERPPPAYTKHRPIPLSLPYKRSISSDVPSTGIRMEVNHVPTGTGNGFQRSYSDIFPAIPEEDETPDSPHLLKTTALYSSTLSLIMSPAPNETEHERNGNVCIEGSPSPNMRRFRFQQRPSIWSQMTVHSRNNNIRPTAGSFKPTNIEEDVRKIKELL